MKYITSTRILLTSSSLATSDRLELSSVVLLERGASVTIRGPMMKPRALPPSRQSQDSPVAIVRWWAGNQRELTTEGSDTTNGPILPLRIPPCNKMEESAMIVMLPA